MGGVRGDPSGGILQAPEVRLFRNAEVTPSGVRILSAGHPWHRRRLWPVRESDVGDFLSGYL